MITMEQKVSREALLAAAACREEGLVREEKLCARLAELGRYEDITRMVRDREYREQLFEEFGI